MEKDIVERLRAAEVEYDPEGVWEEERLNALFKEAATEIERLREKVENLELAAAAYRLLGQECAYVAASNSPASDR